MNGSGVHRRDVVATLLAGPASVGRPAFAQPAPLEDAAIGRSTTCSRVRTDNLAGCHARTGRPVHGIGPVRVVQADEQDQIAAAAGGHQSSAHDIAASRHVLLARGARSGGGRLRTERQADEMWRAQSINGRGPPATAETPARSMWAPRLLAVRSPLAGEISIANQLRAD